MNNFYRIILAIALICILEFNSFVHVNGGEIDAVVKKSDKILSRRRRYLIFPEGSSFQLLYDSDYYAPDYTQYFMTGLQFALAWALPSKPTYPDYELMEQYENGKLPLLLKRKDENTTDPDTNQGAPEQKHATQPQNISHNIRLDHRTMMHLFRKFFEASRLEYSDHNSAGHSNRYGSTYRPIDSYYYRNHGNNSIWTKNYYNSGGTPSKNMFSWTRPSPSRYGTSSNKVFYYSDVYGGGSSNIRAPLLSNSVPLKKNSYDAFTNYIADTYFKPWIEGADALNANVNVISQKPTTRRPSTTTSTTESGPIIRKLHTVYPALGKRSTKNYAKTFEEKFYLDHHRDTRHDLYNLIEKFLFAKGYNGTACVLKTLCEVGQKRQEQKPGSFLAEIIRVIFSLPEPQLKHAIQKRYIDYDEAHATSANCTQRYSSCRDSVWNSAFLLESYRSVLK